MSDQPPLNSRPRAAVKSPEAPKPRIASTKTPLRANAKTTIPKPRGNPAPTTVENPTRARLAAFASVLSAQLGAATRALVQRWNAVDWAHLRERLTQYAQLARLHKPIGAALLLWPTWWALWLAAGDFPPWPALIIFTVGVFLMRSAGCVINDYADRKLDPEVKRTMDRPIAAGKVTPREALTVFTVLITLAFMLVLFTNMLTIKLSLVGAALAASYPFMKRFTNLPQVYLGVAFGWSVPMAFAAVSGSLPPVCWLLFLANVVWSTIYDTQYAMVDRDDDIRVGAKSTAILFGDVNPSGKLPTTLAAAREDYPDFGHFPGVNGSVDYAEGVYVGYRHFDKANVTPLFPFGYGLSFTTFHYGPITLSKAILTPRSTVTATVSIKNTGKRAGAEVVEMYVHDPTPMIDRPVRELKGFQKVFLNAGETKLVSFSVTPRALAYCDAPNMQWKSNQGTYEIQIGSSSRDIRQKAPLRLISNWTEATPTLTQAVEAPKFGDLAAGRPALASSVEASLVAKNAVDSDGDSRWGSEFSDPQWIAIDLGKTVKVSRVVLSWEDAYATDYSIQVSPDGKSWTDVYHTTSGRGETEEIKFTPTDARWVRMFGTKRATQFGYSLFSYEIYK